MRIALLTETFLPDINGVAMTMGVVAQKLSDMGHHVVVVCPKNKKREISSTAQSYIIEEVFGIPIPNYPEAKIGLAMASHIEKIIQEHSIDAIYLATEGPLYFAGLKAAKRQNKIVVSGFHTHFEEYCEHFKLGFIKNTVTKHLARLHNKTKHTLVPSEHSLNKIQKLGINNGKIFTRGVNTNLYSPHKKDLHFRQQVLKSKPEDIVLLTTGRLSPEKNLLILKEIAQQPHTKLVFVGDGPFYKTLLKQFPKAIFTKFLTGEQLAKSYASADVFLFPSLTETFGNVALEAAASELPIVGFNTGALNMMFTHQKNAIISHSKQEFIQGVNTLIENHEMRTEIGKAAREVAIQHPWDNAITQFCQAFNA